MKGGSGGMRARRALEVLAARKSTPVVSIDEVEPKQIVNDADLLEEAMDYFLQKKIFPTSPTGQRYTTRTCAYG